MKRYYYLLLQFGSTQSGFWWQCNGQIKLSEAIAFASKSLNRDWNNVGVLNVVEITKDDYKEAISIIERAKEK